LSLDGRYPSPSGEAAGCEPRAHALGTTAGRFIDRNYDLDRLASMISVPASVY